MNIRKWLIIFIAFGGFSESCMRWTPYKILNIRLPIKVLNWLFMRYACYGRAFTSTFCYTVWKMATYCECVFMTLLASKPGKCGFISAKRHAKSHKFRFSRKFAKIRISSKINIAANLTSSLHINRQFPLLFPETMSNNALIIMKSNRKVLTSIRFVLYCFLEGLRLQRGVGSLVWRISKDSLSRVMKMATTHNDFRKYFSPNAKHSVNIIRNIPHSVFKKTKQMRCAMEWRKIFFWPRF